MGKVSHETMQVHFQSAVQDLHLAICLGVVGGAEIKGGALQAKKLLPKRIDKNRVTIRDDGFRGSMKVADVNNEALGELSGGVCGR